MMPWIIAIGGLFVSALWGAASLMDKVDDVTQPTETKSLINLGTGTLLAVGGLAVWYLLKKK